MKRFDNTALYIGDLYLSNKALLAVDLLVLGLVFEIFHGIKTLRGNK